ncbi:hypothetical protein [Saccharibacillus kuerlensis]|uniref:Uncharacterized protein n=1 Tax=Saccharibacillus kuerlensis TaxID=459527 RepID=A0ABQ2KSF6_9BACL|nr:hypothetical protein [Saccharibacillus kuerlensis]GGN91448.1 hypothetical protein GCM10010969_03150 [Saccharibacillus kuerlensis]
MNKRYEIKAPKSSYVQIFGAILSAILLLLIVQKDDFLSVFFVVILFLASLIQVVMLLKGNLRKNNELEITEHTIKINHTEVPIQKIEKVIIQGYFAQSIGIKLSGRKLVKMNLHFRFKNNEENNVEELKQWASMNSIEVTNGKIYRWI